MYVHALAVTPNGAQVSVHRLHRVTLEQTRVLLTINHFADENQELPTWQDDYAMPLELFAMGSYPSCVFQYMVAADGLFPGGQVMDGDSDLETLRKKTVHSINRMRDGLINGVYTVQGLGVFEIDKTSTENIMGAVQVAVISKMANQPFSISWRRADNTNITLDADQMIAVGTSVAAFRSAVYERSWELKALVDAATTLEELQSIVLDGWPQF